MEDGHDDHGHPGMQELPRRAVAQVTRRPVRGPQFEYDRYNIVSEDDLRMAVQKTILYVDTLPTTRTDLQMRTLSP